MRKPISQYPKSERITKANVDKLMSDDVVDVRVELKTDGSNFAFRRHDDGTVSCMSRTVAIENYTLNKSMQVMFSETLEKIRSISDKLDTKYTYRVEWLNNHNKIKYDKLPYLKMVLIDVQDADTDEYLGYDVVVAEATRLGLSAVPLLWRGKPTMDMYLLFETMLQQKTFCDYDESSGNPPNFLGVQYEGIVVKGYLRPVDGASDYPVFIFLKMVSPDYDELNHVKLNYHSGPGITTQLGNALRSTVKYEKAYQHLRDSGVLTMTPADIPDLANAVKEDIISENRDFIMEAMYNTVKNGLTVDEHSSTTFVETLKQQLWDKNINALLKKATSDIGKWYKRDVLLMRDDESMSSNNNPNPSPNVKINNCWNYLT